MRALLLALVSLPSMSPAVAQGTIATTYEIGPIRLTAVDLQAALSDVLHFVAAANGESEEDDLSIALQHNGAKVSVTDVVDVVPAMARMGSATQLYVHFRASSRASPITSVTFSFHNSHRELTVEGVNAVQVDACATLARDRLNAHVAVLGGLGAQIAFGASWYLLMFLIPLLPIRWRRWIALTVWGVCLAGMVATWWLPFADWLPGMLVTDGDASLLLRYSPHLTFVGTLASIAGVTLPFVLRQRRQQKPRLMLASALEIDQRTGIGSKLACEVVQLRESEQTLSEESLRRIRGLGPVRLKRILTEFTLGSGDG